MLISVLVYVLIFKINQYNVNCEMHCYNPSVKPRVTYFCIIFQSIFPFLELNFDHVNLWVNI